MKHYYLRLAHAMFQWTRTGRTEPLEAAAVEASATIWRERNANRAAERRAINSPWHHQRVAQRRAVNPAW